MPKVTVYIPAYNYGRYIEKAINSILRQTMSDWELIIIDDGSTDNTSSVIAKYRSHSNIRIIEQENRGLNVTNNIAVRLSNGRYIMRFTSAINSTVFPSKACEPTRMRRYLSSVSSCG